MIRLGSDRQCNLQTAGVQQREAAGIDDHRVDRRRADRLLHTPSPIDGAGARRHLHRPSRQFDIIRGAERRKRRSAPITDPDDSDR